MNRRSEAKSHDDQTVEEVRLPPSRKASFMHDVPTSGAAIDAAVRPRSSNRLLSTMSDADYALLFPHFEPVELSRGQVLVEPGQPIQWAWFFESGVGSVIAVSPEGSRVEAGLFGRDAVAPGSLVLGIAATPYQILVQLPGVGVRMPASALLRAMDASPSLRGLLNRYVQTMHTQCSYTALSNAIHQIDERCARWLLMVHDRTDGDEIQLTHESLSLMLAVRRPSVTTALHVLEGNRLIRADRGYITIRDRAALEEFAGDAYGASEQEYARLICPMK